MSSLYRCGEEVVDEVEGDVGRVLEAMSEKVGRGLQRFSVFISRNGGLLRVNTSYYHSNLARQYCISRSFHSSAEPLMSRVRRHKLINYVEDRDCPIGTSILWGNV